MADLSSGTVDLTKVSKAVKNFVANVAKLDGGKKKIDSEREYFALSEHLAGNFHNLNKDEIGYIQGFMIEYQNSQKEKFEKDYVTDSTKAEVSKIAKRMGNKKTIDTDEEAQALALLLKNSHNDLNGADIVYIKSLLIENGYEQYLEPEKPSVTVVNVVVNQTTEKKDECKPHDNKEIPGTKNPFNSTDIKKENVPNDKYISQPKIDKRVTMRNSDSLKAKGEADRAEDAADKAAEQASRAAKEADRATEEATRAAKEADRAEEANKKPKVKEAARAQGFGIANKIEEQLNNVWTDNHVIQKEFSKVNSENAFSFVGKMLEISDSNTVFGDSRKRISYKNLKHVTASLLNQALRLELGKTTEWKNLKTQYDAINRQVDKDPYKTPDEYDIDKLNSAFKALYKKMSTVYQ